MRRTLLPTSLLSLALLMVGATAAAASSLVRIETRPFYGATVTIEEGVRVFRPLPPTRYMFINPDGKTPLNLTFEERNVTVHHHQYIYGVGSDEQRFSYGGGSGFFVGNRHKPRGAHHGRRSGGYLIGVPGAARSGFGGGGKK